MTTPLTYIHADRIIDGTPGGVFEDACLVIENGRVKEILPHCAPPQDAMQLQLRGGTILPGFIDTHLHLMLNPGHPTLYFDPEQPLQDVMLRTVANAQASLRVGVTTVGDCGALNEIIFPLRDAINRGEITGPRILASGRPIVPTGGHGAAMGQHAKGVEEVRAAVRTQTEAGADFIKVMATAGGGEEPGESHYTLEELQALQDEAAKHGLVVAAHAHGSQGIKDCAIAGIERIEHCTFYNGEAGFKFDPDTARMIADKGIIVSPTNVIDYRRIEQGGVGAPRAELNEVWRKLLQFGIRFAASSDAGVTDLMYDDYALIPETMVRELGMSPMEAITACTKTAAEALRVDKELGTLEPGKLADLVIVQGNPLQNIEACRNVQMVMKAGLQVA